MSLVRKGFRRMQGIPVVRKSLLVLCAVFVLTVGVTATPSCAQDTVNDNALQASEQTAYGLQQEMQGIAETQKDQDELPDPNLYTGIHEAYQRTIKMRGEPSVIPDQIKTLFFTLWQHKLLQEAKRGFWTRRPEEYELNRQDGQKQRIKGPRELSLGGIIYKAPEDWVVWLNSQRITPDAIPKEVIDIRVNKDYVELKWFDSWTNLIYPVRLRPHQRFNIDSRIFLPGTSTL